MEEKKLLAQLRQGNQEAVAEWFHTYSAQLLASVEGRVCSKADAEEIVQQTFLNCLKHLPLFLGNSSIWTWMNAIARHEIADYFRKKYAKKALQTVPLSEFLAFDQIADSHDVSNKVTSVLSHMNQFYKELLLLKYADGKTVATIASEYNKTIKSVESDLFRARLEFKKLWELSES